MADFKDLNTFEVIKRLKTVLTFALQAVELNSVNSRVCRLLGTRHHLLNERESHIDAPRWCNAINLQFLFTRFRHPVHASDKSTMTLTGVKASVPQQSVLWAYLLLGNRYMETNNNFLLIVNFYTANHATTDKTGISGSLTVCRTSRRCNDESFAWLTSLSYQVDKFFEYIAFQPTNNLNAQSLFCTTAISTVHSNV